MHALEPVDILQQYWGFEGFRALQEEIKRSVLAGKDTLALLPTGGGKSICFQVPAMAMEGIAIVVSPLIALMHDQIRAARADLEAALGKVLDVVAKIQRAAKAVANVKTA